MRDKYSKNNVEQNNNKRLLEKQREIYYAQVREENNGNIQQVDLSKMPYDKLQNTIFHYSLKKDKSAIDREGLKARIGRNSAGTDYEPAIYFSYGLEGALETWDVWLKWRANRLNSPYWKEENNELVEKLDNGIATEQEKKEYYYKAQLWNEEFISGKYREDNEKMKTLFDFQIDEMLASNYYVLDLKEGEEFSFDEVDVKKEHALFQEKNEPEAIGYKMFKEMYGQYSNYDSNKVEKWNMNTFLGEDITISPDRIKQLTLPNGKKDVLSIIEFLYDKYQEKVPKNQQVEFDLLDKYMAYVKEKIKSNDIPTFDVNERINEIETISQFHDQKSDEYFNPSSRRLYTNSEYKITEKQIGKKGFLTHIEKKDIAKRVVDTAIKERTNSQELDAHKNQGGSSDGR